LSRYTAFSSGELAIKKPAEFPIFFDPKRPGSFAYSDNPCTAHIPSWVTGLGLILAGLILAALGIWLKD
jgi:hypothetical protein